VISAATTSIGNPVLPFRETGQRVTKNKGKTNVIPIHRSYVVDFVFLFFVLVLKYKLRFINRLNCREGGAPERTRVSISFAG
jgi:hypothetical protein